RVMVPGSQQRVKLLKDLLWKIYQLNKITEQGKEQVTVKLKRVYDEAATHDAKRTLVDRVCPLGVSKERADEYDSWKEIRPTKELRRWFNHDPEKFTTFKKKYREELQSGDQKAAYDQLKEIQKSYSTITLVFSAKDEENNQAQVLKEMLEGK